ncbi:MAG: hypothetical protein WAO61_01470, partial [Solirubrobacterales bacterium]
PGAAITASDISAGALEVAAANAARLGLAARVRFTGSDLLDDVDGVFDAIAANLPYVSAGAFDALQPEITRYEPRAALDGGRDGLDLVRRLVAAAPTRLKPGGLLALEIGDAQATATAGLFAAAGLTEIETHADLAGRDRVVSGWTVR